jgi:hypothetical protein
VTKIVLVMDGEGLQYVVGPFADGDSMIGKVRDAAQEFGFGSDVMTLLSPHEFGEDLEDITKATAALAEGGEPIPLEEL